MMGLLWGRIIRRSGDQQSSSRCVLHHAAGGEIEFSQHAIHLIVQDDGLAGEAEVKIQRRLVQVFVYVLPSGL
jgi:hypothetical protein